MPVFELTYPEGAIEAEAREKLLEDLTAALLHAERAPDTEFFRSVTWAYIHELPAAAVRAAGRPVAEPTFKIDVTTPEGALSDRRRGEFVEAATAAVSEAAGLGEEDALRVFVLMHEVAEGSWGAGGQIVQFKQLAEIAKGEREKDEAVAPAGA